MGSPQWNDAVSIVLLLPKKTGQMNKGGQKKDHRAIVSIREDKGDWGQEVTDI